MPRACADGREASANPSRAIRLDETGILRDGDWTLWSLSFSFSAPALVLELGLFCVFASRALGPHRDPPENGDLFGLSPGGAGCHA